MGIWKTSLFHPDYQNQGVGIAIVNKLLEEAERMGLEILTVNLMAAEHKGFYEKGGFIPCPGGLWRK